MLKLTHSALVEHRMNKAFKFENAKNAKRIEKYVAMLEKEINALLIFGRDVYDSKMGFYKVNLSNLYRNGGRIGKRGDLIHLHDWLRDNAPLFQIVNIGNSINKELSTIKLTDLVTVTDKFQPIVKTQVNTAIEQQITAQQPIMNYTEEQILQDKQLDQFLFLDEQNCAELVAYLYSELNDMSEEDYVEQYDSVTVDIESLKRYIKYVNSSMSKYSQHNRDIIIRQSKIILCVATHFDGIFPQRKKKSEFGRTYYHGISVQSVNKTLRGAMVGDSYGYDLRSAAIAFKWSFTSFVAELLGQSVERTFWATKYYLTRRDDFRKEVIAAVFKHDSTVNKKLQVKLIKQAITAISFGAKAKNVGWLGADGKWTNSAIMDIIKVKEERERFFECGIIKHFIYEQSLLDQYIASDTINSFPELANTDICKSGKSLSNSKLVAFAYQNFESCLMSIVYNYFDECGLSINAKIHDGLISEHSLSMYQMDELNYRIRSLSGNEYMMLVKEDVDAFNIDVDAIERQEQFERAHRAHIQREEAMARCYEHKSFDEPQEIENYSSSTREYIEQVSGHKFNEYKQYSFDESFTVVNEYGKHIEIDLDDEEYMIGG